MSSEPATEGAAAVDGAGDDDRAAGAAAAAPLPSTTKDDTAAAAAAEDAAAAQQPQQQQQPQQAQQHKVVLAFQAAGGAPLLKQDRVKIAPDARFSKVVAFLKRQLRSDAVFVYLRSAFCPALDDEVGALARAYGAADGRSLTVSYALTPAWG